MEKLLIYYNTHTNAFINKWVLNTEYKEGDFNQFDHLVCQVIVHDLYSDKLVSFGNKKIVYKKEKKGLINHLLDLLYKRKKD